MQYECTECGQMGRFVDRTGSAFAADCPVCEELTRWEAAFLDEEEGVSF